MMQITSAFYLLVTNKKHKIIKNILAQFCFWKYKRGCERRAERRIDPELQRERGFYYLEFIRARSFFAFFLAFWRSSPSFILSEETELSVRISTIYFFKERCSWKKLKTNIRPHEHIHVCNINIAKAFLDAVNKFQLYLCVCVCIYIFLTLMYLAN